MTQDWSFDCNACGKCCNSPPLLTLPELFRHARRFIGALGVRRVRLPADAHEHAQAERLLHRMADGSGWIALTPHAIESPSVSRCPALRDDGRCDLHDSGKPLACRVVPLDALRPDPAQHAVLASRAQNGPDSLGADCIMPTATAATVRWKPLTVAGRLIDAHALHDLGAHRDALIADRRDWGDAVFAQLRAAHIEHHLPADGMLSLPLTPVLQTLAARSRRHHEDCVAYLEAQHALIAERISLALSRKDPAARPFTRHLRQLAEANGRLLAGLRQVRPASFT